MDADFDLAVIGSGFGGSLLAMLARRLGRSVVLLERGRHPRFAIGESSTPLANLLLEELARRYGLPEVAPLAKWGSWQKARPEIACGLKRGFTFYHHVLGQPWKETPHRGNELLVAASPHDGVADTHWYRSDFDQFCVRAAQHTGAEFLDEVKLSCAQFSEQGGELSGERAGGALKLRARFVVDASGPRGFLHGVLALPEVSWATLPATQGLYTHFRSVRRWDELHAPAGEPPYPVDDAALHHVFDGGWIWVLRFNHGVTSAGLAAGSSLAEALQLAEGKAAWERLLERLPAVREQFAGATECLPFQHAPRLSFRSGSATGERWALLPSAAGFVDPLLSTGFPLTLLGLERLAQLLEEDWDSPRWAEGLRAYGRQTFHELDGAAALIGALYANLHDAEVFNALTLLYFAAATYAETARRLQRPGRPPAFLLLDHPQFGPAFRACVEGGLRGARRDGSGAEKRVRIRSILEAIEPINLARLGDPARRNWYPARGEDLLEAAPKLGVDRSAMEDLLTRCGFAAR